MKLILIILAFSLLIGSCNTPDTKTAKASKIEIASSPVSNPNNHDEIGFACGAGGEGTALVDEFTKRIIAKNYNHLTKKLYSARPGEVYLATVTCEKLEEEGMIRLKATELNQIEKNKRNTDTIYTCAGCGESEYFTVKQLLNDTTNYMSMGAVRWLDEILGKNSIKE